MFALHRAVMRVEGIDNGKCFKQCLAQSKVLHACPPPPSSPPFLPPHILPLFHSLPFLPFCNHCFLSFRCSRPSLTSRPSYVPPSLPGILLLLLCPPLPPLPSFLPILTWVTHAGLISNINSSRKPYTPPRSLVGALPLCSRTF